MVSGLPIRNITQTAGHARRRLLAAYDSRRSAGLVFPSLPGADDGPCGWFAAISQRSQLAADEGAGSGQGIRAAVL
jgi:hypothetical protein